METKSEFVRLVNNEPLTLRCSAIADFLWEDFVREARPLVKFLENEYNIKQLCRFGKEVFDRLYTGDQVDWLISEEEYEQFFRATCNGEAPPMPKGYKPEHSFWWLLMEELSNAAAWPILVTKCVGDQFNAGNNAVSIINQLAEVIEEEILQQHIDIKTVFGSGDKLEELRDQFKQAVSEGDEKAANKARQEGKQLGNKIMESAKAAMQQVQGKIDSVVDETIKQSDELNEGMANLWGSQSGTGRDCGDLQEKKNLAQKLKTNTQLRKLAKQLGALKRTWIERKRARKNKETYASIVGAKFSNDITKAFSTELALANTAEGRALFAIKYSQKTLLSKDYEADCKNLNKGPIVMYIDVSGSMRGTLEIWSKAIAFVIAEEALKEKREIQIHLFDTVVTNSVTLQGDRKNNEELIDFIQRWTLGGGTSFNAVIIHAVNKLKNNDKADVLMITDGNSTADTRQIQQLQAIKAATGLQWSTVCLEVVPSSVCYGFSDEVFSVNLNKPAEAVDVIQKSFR